MSFVYSRTEPSLWTVGFYSPDGKWESVSDHASDDEAAARVALLNGGNGGDVEMLLSCLRECADYLDCIPESAAGGDDDAVRISRRARAALSAGSAA